MKQAATVSLLPMDALVVWCPTWSKNLGRTLLLTCASGRKHNSAILKKNSTNYFFFSGSWHESRSGPHAFDCFIRTRYKKYVRSYIQWTQSLAHHASQFLHYHTYIQKVEEKTKVTYSYYQTYHVTLAYGASSYCSFPT